MCIKCNESYAVDKATRMNPLPQRYIPGGRVVFEGEADVIAARRERYANTL